MPVVRPYGDDDEDAVLVLLAGSLGWLPDDDHRAFFRWKHLQNPAGRSAMWVAEEAGRVVGFRSMLRWRFCLDGEPVRAVRAVDTATAPESRGSGIFRQLTMHAVDQLRDEGVAFVFNTPNEQSRPGYLKMGWVELGRAPAALRPSGAGGIVRMVRSRTPAELRSVPTTAGVPAEDALARWPEPPPARAGVTTDRSSAYLRWRYGAPAWLGYRAIETADGRAVFRLRRRGRCIEGAVCELDASGGRAQARLLRDVARCSGAHHLLRLGSARLPSEVPVPRGGPVVTWRALARAEAPPLERWNLSLGDIELF